MANRICSVAGCGRPRHGRGWCTKHYQRWKRHGDPNKPGLTTSERFWSKVEKTDTCWLWTAAKNTDGYGRFKGIDRLVQAHRFAYEQLIGPIPEGLHLDHLCRVRACVNPAHLEPVTLTENLRRGRNPRSEKTHCPQGHPYDEANTYVSPRGGRFCRICRNESARRCKQRKKLLPAIA